MNIFNLNEPSLNAILDVANSSNIPLEIDNQGFLGIEDWAQFKEKLKTIQEIYFTNKTNIEIAENPPFEIHPYIGSQSIINNTHKTVVLGTFPPPSYFHVLYPALSNGNLFIGINIDSAPLLYYFYGNRGSLWDILGLEHSQEPINEHLQKSHILISDIILFTQRTSLTLKRASDSNYINIIPNIPLVKHLAYQENSIENIVFTSKQWSLTDGIGRGRRSSNYVPKTIQFTEGNSAISLFFRTLYALNIPIGFKKVGSDEIVSFIPENYNRINVEFTDLFAFYLVLNSRQYLINLGDSPSGNAFTPFDSISFIKWIKFKYGENGLQVVRSHPRNSKNEKIKRERKIPIQLELNYPAGSDICNDYQYEMYTMFLQRNFRLIEQIQNQII